MKYYDGMGREVTEEILNQRNLIQRMEEDNNKLFQRSKSKDKRIMELKRELEKTRNELKEEKTRCQQATAQPAKKTLKTGEATGGEPKESEPSKRRKEDKT